MSNYPVKQRKINRKVIQVEIDEGIPYDVSTGDIIDPKQLRGYSKTKEYRLINVNNTNLAEGIHINTYEKTSLRFLRDLKDYEESADNPKSQISVANKLFRHEETVSTGLEILIDFTCNKYEFVGLSDQLKILIDYLDKNLNSNLSFFSPIGLSALLDSMAHEYFISGNIFPAEVWETVEIKGKSYSLPTEIRLLNPMNVDIDPISFTQMIPRLFFSFGGFDETANRNVEDLLREQKLDFEGSPIFKGKIKTKPSHLASQIELDTQFVSHIKRKARDYDMWGIPYLTKLIKPVAYKQKLWQLDIQTIEGMINYITIFKVGSPDKDSPYHVVKKNRLTSFANLVGSPQASTAIVWPHDIDVITAGPSGEVLSFNDKYREANRAIIQGLGVPPILIDGTGTATAAWTTLIALNKRLEIVRSILKNYIFHLMQKIAVRNKIEFTSDEKLIWFPTELRNEQQVKQLLLAYYDRGLLPIQTTHQMGGYKHSEMLEIKKDELERNLDETFSRPDVPFASPPSKDQTPGRPSDNIDTRKDDERERERQDAIKFAKSIDLIAETYKDQVMKLIDGLEDNIFKLKKRSKSQIDDLILITITRLNQVADTFSTFEDDQIDVTFSSKLSLFHQHHLNNLQEFLIKSMKNMAIHKTGDEKEIVISGIISKAKKRLELFVSESLRNIELAQSLSKKSSEGYVGALISTPEDTECEYCRELDNNYVSLTEAFDLIPTHPHQHYELIWQSEDPRLSGHKNTPTAQSPKNKSRSL